MMETEETRLNFTAVFAGSIVLANVLIAKLTWIELPELDGVAVPAGLVSFGIRETVPWVP